MAKPKQRRHYGVYCSETGDLLTVYLEKTEPEAIRFATRAFGDWVNDKKNKAGLRQVLTDVTVAPVAVTRIDVPNGET